VAQVAEIATLRLRSRGRATEISPVMEEASQSSKATYSRAISVLNRLRICAAGKANEASGAHEMPSAAVPESLKFYANNCEHRVDIEYEFESIHQVRIESR